MASEDIYDRLFGNDFKTQQYFFKQKIVNAHAQYRLERLHEELRSAAEVSAIPESYSIRSCLEDAFGTSPQFIIDIGRSTPLYNVYNAERISVIVPTDGMGNRAEDGIGIGKQPSTFEIALIGPQGILDGHPLIANGNDSVQRFYDDDVTGLIAFLNHLENYKHDEQEVDDDSQHMVEKIDSGVGPVLFLPGTRVPKPSAKGKESLQETLLRCGAMKINKDAPLPRVDSPLPKGAIVLIEDMTKATFLNGRLAKALGQTRTVGDATREGLVLLSGECERVFAKQSNLTHVRTAQDLWDDRIYRKLRLGESALGAKGLPDEGCSGSCGGSSSSSSAA